MAHNSVDLDFDAILLTPARYFHELFHVSAGLAFANLDVRFGNERVARNSEDVDEHGVLSQKFSVTLEPFETMLILSNFKSSFPYRRS
jgi:hypothetical protein